MKLLALFLSGFAVGLAVSWAYIRSLKATLSGPTRPASRSGSTYTSNVGARKSRLQHLTTTTHGDLLTELPACGQSRAGTPGLSRPSCRSSL